MNDTIFELLAPAGSYEILKAVIDAGADAVYVGGTRFGARAYADNFKEEELVEAIDYVHLRGKKLYLTVNTLLCNEELEALYDYLLPYYRAGLDAVLVQDIGVMQMIGAWFSDLPLHTSTQMTLTAPDSVRLMAELGIKRVVLPRELSLKEMRRIHEATGMELEAFVHGALCYCYSGQCLMSSIFGGRSGNRGRCAQPCRLPYAVRDADGKLLSDASYLLSMKDLCGIDSLRGLYEAGVYSLKIEGRMKQRDYAAGVVSVYRKEIDRFADALHENVPLDDSIAKEARRNLAAFGSRSGITDAYFVRHNGADMISKVDPGYRKQSAREETGPLRSPKSKRPITGEAVFRVGEQARLLVKTDTCEVCVSGSCVSEAKSKPVTSEELAARLGKTGDTPFDFWNLRVEVDANAFYPNGAVNRLRRAALETLQEKLLCAYRREEPRPDREAVAAERTVDMADPTTALTFSAVVSDIEQLAVVLEDTMISEVGLELAAFADAASVNRALDLIRTAQKSAFLGLPYILREKTKKVFGSLLSEIPTEGYRGFLVRNFEEIVWVRSDFPEKTIRSDANVYAWNDAAVRMLNALGAEENTVPLELSRAQIARRDNSKSRMILYGHYPLMISAQCIRRNTKGCDHKPKQLYLIDRYGNRLMASNTCRGCYNVIYNGLPTMLFGKLDDIRKSNLTRFRLCFTGEDAGTVRRVLSGLHAVLRGEAFTAKPNTYTNGHYTRGVE